ncbi:MAG: hypothetical protein ACK6DB_07900 [Planctomycetota bacterium]
MPFLDHYQIVKEQIAKPNQDQHKGCQTQLNPATFIEGGESSFTKAFSAANQNQNRPLLQPRLTSASIHRPNQAQS